MKEIKRFQIEKYRFDQFMRDYKERLSQHLRLGQAFFNYFDLHKMSSTDFCVMYNIKCEKEAMDYIQTHFEMV